MKSIYKPASRIADRRSRMVARRKIRAFISGIMSDEPAVGGDIFIVPAEGGEARNITPGMKASASWLTWPAGAKSFLVKPRRLKAA